MLGRMLTAVFVPADATEAAAATPAAAVVRVARPICSYFSTVSSVFLRILPVNAAHHSWFGDL